MGQFWIVSLKITLLSISLQKADLCKKKSYNQLITVTINNI